MEPGDLYVQAGPRGRRTDCPVLIRWLSPAHEMQEVRGKVAVDPAELDGPLPHLGQFRGLIDLIESHASALALPSPGSILLDIQAPDLYRFDWEGLLRLRRALSKWDVTRFRDESDERLLQPFDLPVRLLQAFHLNQAHATPDDYATRYYRAHRVTEIGDADLSETLRSGRYDIVHLVMGARWSKDKGEISIASIPDWIGAGELNRCLKTCRARVVILQCLSPQYYPPTLDMAHRLLRAGGPTVVVVDGATSDYLTNLYMDIVHDIPLRLGSGVRHDSDFRIASFCSIGGADVLRISPLAQHLASTAERSAAALDELALALGRLGAPTRGDLGRVLERYSQPPSADVTAMPTDILDALSVGATLHRDIARRTYDYSHESGAWIPLGRDMRLKAQLGSVVKRLQRAVGRVVNVGFVDGDSPLPSRALLRPGRQYALSIQIGRRAAWSLVDGTAAIPEALLERHYKHGGTELRIVVFAPSFEINESDRRLPLPPPPLESDELRIALRAPEQEGRHRIRVCLYHENNLLQSILLRVGVYSQAPRARDPGLVAEVEFALSATLTDPERLPKRDFNFLTNAGDDGTHTIAVVGGPFRTSFDFGESEMRAAVDDVRDSLYRIAADTKSDPPKYRFDKQNSTTVERLELDVARLAELGYLLYTNLVTGKDRKFENQLRDALGPSGARIQISALKSAKYVFPWSLVYDHPLVVGSVSLCSQFAADMRAVGLGKGLHDQLCLTQGCPNLGNPSIVCPSGFWGFKHRIEQPLSVSTEANESGARDVVLELKAGPPGTDLPALMAISRALKQVGAHETELRSPPSFKFLVKDTKAEIGILMKGAGPSGISVIYFYCHGARDKSRTWLGIGTKEKLVPSDLKGWGIDWTGNSPLVFINGCHTVDVTPDDLLNFNSMFNWCRAAGVIGTEISIPEELARAFACGFMTQFACGVSVGDALRAQRLALLERCNLLGLAYTPYCSSNLHVVRQ